MTGFTVRATVTERNRKQELDGVTDVVLDSQEERALTFASARTIWASLSRETAGQFRLGEVYDVAVTPAAVNGAAVVLSGVVSAQGLRLEMGGGMDLTVHCHDEQITQRNAGDIRFHVAAEKGGAVDLDDAVYVSFTRA